jgi:hypothetical protein
MLGLTKTKASFRLKTDPGAILENIRNHLSEAQALEILSPYLKNHWLELQDTLITYGIDTVLSCDPALLERIPPSFTRILKPSFPLEALGAATKGVIPVLEAFTQCAALSNLAQMHNLRLSYSFRIRSQTGQLSSCLTQIETILNSIKNLPSIALVALYADFGLDEYEHKILLERLHSLGIEQELRLYQPLSAVYNKNATAFLTHETLALGKNAKGVFPYEIAFEAYPVGEVDGEPVFRADAGLIDGLPDNFPISVPTHQARLLKVEPRYFLFKLSRPYQGSFPLIGYLSGGDLLNPVDLSLWQEKHLITLLESIAG